MKAANYRSAIITLLILCSLPTCFVASATTTEALPFSGGTAVEIAAAGRFKEAREALIANLKANKADAISQSSLSLLDDLEKKKITPEYALFFFKGLELMQKGAIGQAIEKLSDAAKLDPAYPKTYNVLGVAYTFLGDTQNAESSFLQAVEKDSRYTQAYFNLAALYQSKDRTEEAVKYYKIVLSLDPGSREAFSNCALIYSATGKYQEAISLYQKALRLDKNDPDIYYDLALAYFMSEQLVKFRSSLLKAAELYRQKNDEKGLAKVEEYLKKIKDLEEKMKTRDNR